MRGLAVRVLLLLTLAMLPIGLIALVQTRQITDQSQTNAELSLLAVTERASAGEQRVVQEAFGAARALGSIVRLRHTNPAECSTILREYRDAYDKYALVGFIAADGTMSCSSTDQPADFSDDALFKAMMEERSLRASAVERGHVTGQSVTVINSPVFDEGEIIGMMAISIPSTVFSALDEPELAQMPLAVVTFNSRGQILTTEKERELVEPEMPADVALAAFSGKKSKVFWSRNTFGEMRAYAVMPVVPDAVYAMTVWPDDTPLLKFGLSTQINVILPVTMWVASLIVAFLALNRLALNHIRKLVRQMRRFALNRTLPKFTLGPDVPTELAEMEGAFIEMAESILRDEAQLEDSLRQKNILLKEVHHRVKNNLQLISSIMNMQIRQASSEESRFVLKRLQDRILSLATVHENLYRQDDLVRVDASGLLHEIVNQLLSVGLSPGSNVKVRQHYEKITLDADDAAPLTLLLSEAVTNALKYVSAPAGQEKHIRVDLRYDGENTARLQVENSTGKANEQAGTGLGSRLISAFARQLNGQIEVSESDTSYALCLTFPVPMGRKPTQDY